MSKHSENLRKEYNHNYSQTYDKWSCTDLNVALQIVDEVISHTRQYGLKISDFSKALDVGCAKGYITEALRLRGFESHGLDYSDVAVRIAQSRFPLCDFKHMNGFNPQYDVTFDLILSRGFSGCNTHDIDFVASFSNKYIDLLNPKGFYILAFTSDFSGKENPQKTVCWSYKEIENLSSQLNAKYQEIFLFRESKLIFKLKNYFKKVIGKKHKAYFYLIYQKL